jgi:hypothetical protein
MNTFEKFNRLAIIICSLVMLAVGSSAIAAESTIDVNDVDYFTGRLESIAADSIAVNGTTYTLSEKVQFLSAAGGAIDRSMFSPGEKVKIHVNTSNQVLIVRKI